MSEQLRHSQIGDEEGRPGSGRLFSIVTQETLDLLEAVCRDYLTMDLDAFEPDERPDKDGLPMSLAVDILRRFNVRIKTTAGANDDFHPASILVKGGVIEGNRIGDGPTTDVQPASIVEFLTARLDEDEAAARPVIEYRPDYPYRDEMLWGSDIEGMRVEQWVFCQYMTAERAMAEIAAKRAIIAACEPYASPAIMDADVLRYLALPYSDHPDYRQEWKP